MRSAKSWGFYSYEKEKIDNREKPAIFKSRLIGGITIETEYTYFKPVE